MTLPVFCRHFYNFVISVKMFVGSVSPLLSPENFPFSFHISVFSKQPGHYLRRCGFLLSLSSHKAPDLSGYSCHMFPHSKSGLKYIRIIFRYNTIRIHIVPPVSSSSSSFVITPNISHIYSSTNAGIESKKGVIP